MASPLKYFKPIQLLKRGWNEIPEIIGSTAFAIVNIIAIIGVYNYKQSKGTIDHRRYRMEYTVVRPDDPLAKQSPQYFDYDAAQNKKNSSS